MNLQRTVYGLIINVVVRPQYDTTTFTVGQDSGACEISLSLASQDSTLPY